MEITVPEGTPWYGWVTLLAVVGLGIISPIIVSTVRKTSRTEDTVNSVHEQVANTHSTNLREDIDALRDQIKAALIPIGQIKDAVHRVETKVEVASTAVDYLSDDARQTRREIADLRADQRVNSDKIDRLGEQFTDHLSKEA